MQYQSFAEFKKLHQQWTNIDFNNMGDRNLLLWKLFYAMAILREDIEKC